MSKHPLQGLIEPKSIAVVGVSDNPQRPGPQVVAALRANGFTGVIYPTNPKYNEFQGLKCFASVSDIPDPIDLAVICIPAEAVVEVMEECAARKVPYVVILSGGFRESGEAGIARERRIIEIARNADMRIVGPNCLGFANIHSGVFAAFGSITREPKLAKGGVTLITQSGGFGYSIALACQEAGLGFRHVIATGNECDIDTVEFIDAMIEDPGTRCIVTYVEGLRDGRRLMEVGRKALRAGKPILLWKGGITAQGAKAAESHTASLTGTYDFYRAAFRQTGIVEIREIHEAVDLLLGFEGGRYPEGSGVAIMGVSGGSAIVFADAGEPVGLDMSPLSVPTQERLATVVPGIGAVQNPIDLTAGFFAAANRGKLETALRATLDDPAISAVCVNLATTGASGASVAAEVLGTVAADSAKPILVFSSTPKGQLGEAPAAFRRAGIPVFASPSRAARVLAALRDWNNLRRRILAEGEAPVATMALDPALTEAARSGKTLSETESKAILGRAGVGVSRDLLLAVPDASVFDQLRAPLVVKIVSPDISHKTEIGGVRLDIRDRETLGAAMAEVLANAKRHAPDARIEGVLVGEMITGGFELIAGVVNDEVFGPVVVVGAGGIYAEITRDTAARIAPFDKAEAHRMLNDLRCRPILAGARDLPALDVEAMAEMLAALSHFAWANREVLQEMDINPVFLRPEGATAADALIVARADARKAVVAAPEIA